MDETVWSKLPAEMFVKTMQFLPPVRVLQQRTLSKWVYQATSSVSFNHLYWKQRKRVNETWLLLVQIDMKGSFKDLSSYDFCLEKWYRLPRDNLSNLNGRIDVVASAGSHLLCKGEFGNLPDKLYMCNPLRGTWRELPPMQKQRREPRVGVVHVQEDPADVDGDAFKVVVAGGFCPWGHIKFDLSSEVYDSRTDSWKMTESIPEDFVPCLKFFQYKGSLYSVTYGIIDDAICARDVILYNLESGIWSKVQAAMPEGLMQVNVVECNERLLMVGIVRASSIKIWMLDDSAKNWEEIATMPPDTFNEFAKSISSNFSCTSTYSIGKGRYICLILNHSPLVLKFDMDLNTWTWLPKHLHENGRGLMYWTGMFFNPRLELDHKQS
ncbi:hypothetical protein MPTK1_6g19770 [Marchantia polymorpha subsp. ruderalis]|uniref:KIB1-4 beta-propeller domain-containing protein n=2 Tax=Marchantia polymorpha TaxID=3197 RepID=A0AAF6BTX7_MARPO|nr:hypothetical protein MARPO_0045s0086 [Marchantia polymorpha]BBN15461.1 hypothetical protein Mp_6g19770 [Marchantia polymorpha subsp. ruderalis]|eukprot:PTQ39427.1 hypothetical protein MARPO_0045s0086 [Marchantia polymorpha]